MMSTNLTTFRVLKPNRDTIHSLFALETTEGYFNLIADFGTYQLALATCNNPYKAKIYKNLTSIRSDVKALGKTTFEVVLNVI